MNNLYSQILNSGALDFFPERLTDAYEWQGHIPFAYWLVSTLKPRSLVELGTYKGDSYIALCQSVKKLGLRCQCSAVDTWEGDTHVGQYPDQIFAELRQYHDTRYADFSRLHRMLFDDAVGKFEDSEIDLLHIDGLHTYEAVKNDFESWYPKLSSRSVVMLHDTAVKERGFGVDVYLKELKGKFRVFEFGHSNGLAVVQTGGKIPEELVPFFNTDEAQRLALQKLFKNLGDRVQLSSQVEYWKHKVQKVSLELEREKAKVYFSEEISKLARFVESKMGGI